MDLPNTYTPSGEASGCTAIRSGLAIDSGGNVGSNLSEILGTSAYTILLFCPAISHLVVDDSNSSLNGLSPSGLVVATSSSVTNHIRINHFFGLGDLGGTTPYPILG